MEHQSFMDELNSQFYKDFSTHNDTYKSTTVMEVPKEQGIGYYKFQPLHDFMIFHNRSRYFEDFTISSDATEAYYFVDIILEGSSVFSINKKEIFDFQKNRIYLGYTPQLDKIYSFLPKNSTFSVLSFAFSKQVLLEYLSEFDNIELLKKIEKANKLEVLDSIAMTANHHFIVQNMLNNPYSGALKKIYFENHATQLLFAFLGDLNHKKTKDLVLDNYDKERIHKAKDLLLQDLQNPPTIRELSRIVAINEDKLKKGFKILFDTTIFKTLTQKRMQQALFHVEQNEMNISEIAFEAGYENVSSFIATFRKVYGKTPGVLQKEIRRNI